MNTFRKRLPLVLSVVAVVIAVLGATPAGNAVVDDAGGIGGWEVVEERLDVPRGEVRHQEASCPPGAKVLGGGVTVGPGYTGNRILQSGPAGTGTGWLASVSNADGYATSTSYVWAICADVSP